METNLVHSMYLAVRPDRLMRHVVFQARKPLGDSNQRMNNQSGNQPTDGRFRAGRSLLLYAQGGSD